MELAMIKTEQLSLLITGALLFLILPLLVAIIWKIRKHERFSTILIGAAAFFLFAIILEKPLQNILIFPVQMGLNEHALSRYINARPVLWSFLVGLFPGLFEESGRFITFKTVLKKRRNRETSISYGIGHAGFEVIFILGITYITYIVYALMINSGSFQLIIDQVASQAPDQSQQLYLLASQLSVFSFADLLVALAERVFAYLFHVGASIMVFYACKDKQKFWLYPLAIVLHTALDGIAALNMSKVINLTPWMLEGVVAIFGILVFTLSYILLYRKDNVSSQTSEMSTNEQ